MNCQQFYKHVWDYADQNISEQVEKRLSQHCQECPSCASLYQLTLLENEVLYTKKPVPGLSEDFTDRVMKTIYERHTDLSVRTWRHKLKKTLALNAPLAVLGTLLLVFYLYGNTYYPNNVKIADTQNSSLSSPLDTGLSTGRAAESQMYNEQSSLNPGNIEYGNSSQTTKTPSTPLKSQAKLATTPPVDTTDTISYLQENEALMLDENLTNKATDIPDNKPSRSISHVVAIAPTFSEFPLPVDLPDKYRVQKVSNPNDDQLIVYYQVNSSLEEFTLEIAKTSVKENIEITTVPEVGTAVTEVGTATPASQPTMMSDDTEKAEETGASSEEVPSAETVNNSVDWKIIHDHNQYQITLSGNMSEETLTQIADEINLVEQTDDDGTKLNYNPD